MTDLEEELLMPEKELEDDSGKGERTVDGVVEVV